MRANFKEEMAKAQKNKYALAAFNFDNLEMAKGIVRAAEIANFPVILMVTESSAKYIGLDLVFAFSQTLATNSKAKILLHWDHGFDIDLLKQACNNGFDSVMLDASTKTFEDNVALTKQVVKYAHRKNVYCESEIGHVGGKEDEKTSEFATRTSLKEAIEFNALTKIDALAISIGTTHGIFKKPPKLDFELLENVSRSISTPIVLHGSSGISKADLQKAVSLGVTKVNIGTDLKQVYAKALRNWFIRNEIDFDARKFGEYATNAVMQVALKKINILKDSLN